MVGLVVASALMLVLGLVAPGPAVAAASCSGQSSKTSTVKGLTAGKHPAVLVHGWTGQPLTDTQRLLEVKLGGDWQMFQFEYHSSSNLWAAVPQIAACLATYIADLSQAHQKVGGDGKVYLVGHSMGGLAARFAADPKWGGNPVTDENNKKRAITDLIGGVVTLDTPHGGSPWGNTPYGLIKEALAGFPNPWSAGQLGASRCLALHQGAKGMPLGCDVPPYLAKAIPITQVAGVLTVDRTLFGFHLYDISMGGDTIVPLDSGAGYIGSGIEGKSATVGSSIHMELVPCTIASDRAFGFAATLGAGLLNARLGRALARLDSDNAAMDALSAGKPDPALLQFLALADRVGDCAHTNITHNDRAIAAAATALKADADALQGRTSVTLGDRGRVLVGGKNVSDLPASQAVAAISKVLGKPDVQTTQDSICDTTLAPGQSVTWKDLRVLVPTSPGVDHAGRIAGWELNWYTATSHSGLRTDTGIGIGDTLAAVKRTYLRGALGPYDGSTRYDTPGTDITFYFEETPDRVQSATSGFGCGT